MSRACVTALGNDDVVFGFKNKYDDLPCPTVGNGDSVKVYVPTCGTLAESHRMVKTVGRWRASYCHLGLIVTFQIVVTR